jgi:hypothetical protein
MLGSIGQFVEEVALYWITYEITGSAMALGILGLCSAMPRLILGAFSGVLVDRYDRKLLLILVQFGCAIPISIFLAIYTFGTLAFWHLRPYRRLEREVAIKLISSDPVLDAPSFEVEAILDHRYTDHGYEYLAHWKGYSKEHDSWEPAANFDDEATIARYWSRRGKLTAPRLPSGGE